MVNETSKISPKRVSMPFHPRQFLPMIFNGGSQVDDDGFDGVGHGVGGEVVGAGRELLVSPTTRVYLGDLGYWLVLVAVSTKCRADAWLHAVFALRHDAMDFKTATSAVNMLNVSHATLCASVVVAVADCPLESADDERLSFFLRHTLPCGG